MKVLRLILIVIAVLVATVLIAGLFAPKEVSVQQSINIKAPPAAVFYQVRYLDKMAVWHPLLKKDPNLLTTVIGEDGTVGAVRRWESNDPKVGDGESTILTVEENAYIEYKVNTKSPKTSEGISRFSLVDRSGNTQVIWQFKYEVPYPWNAFLLVSQPTDQLNDYFNEGLRGLKNIMERRERLHVNYMVNDYSMEGGTYAYMREELPAEKIDSFAKRSLKLLTRLRTEAGLLKAGFPIGIIYNWDRQKDLVDYALAIPVVEEDVFPIAKFVTLEDEPVAKTLFVNDLYNDRPSAHAFIEGKLKKEGLEIEYPVFEIYMKGTLAEGSDDNSATRLVYPVASEGDKNGE
ncbi:MAG: SRPBCC family protein [Saprospiraceae bacterium]|nr:SRPBCC family protein [Saprospiraceae bacterium]